MKTILRRCSLTVAAASLCMSGVNALAWGHQVHMTTVAIALFEIERERERPELVGKPGLLFLSRPDPEQRALYNVRVLEIPTPTWLAYDEAHFGPLDLPDDAVMEHQERAYPSPIWYAP